jgi:hypothetical protein
MSDQGTRVGVGIGVGGVGVGVGVADFGSIGTVGDVASAGVGVADVAGVGAVGDIASVGVGATLLGLLGEVVDFLGAALLGILGFLGEVVVGLVTGCVIVGGVGFLLLLIVSVVVEVGQRRGAQVPAYLRAVSPLAPRTLRWVRSLLPGDEGAAWLAEVTSCLAETTDKGERRRYMRSYRRNVPQLIWASWTEHLSASRQRELL